MFRRHPLLSVVTVLYLGVVGLLTLNPWMNTDESSWLWSGFRMLRGWEPTAWVTFNGVEFVANIIMFLPVGAFFLLLLGRRAWWAAVLFGILGSCWIELAQYLWLPTRTSDGRDVISNGIGIVVGVVLTEIVTWPAARRVAASTRSHGSPRLVVQSGSTEIP